MAETLLFISSLIILGVSLFLTVRTRFVQFRLFPAMVRLLFKRGEEGSQTIKSHKALFTAMSTTLGISTLVSPVIAIKLGGPGAILGFLVATLFGTAVNFAEVTFALSYRKKREDGSISGGPMEYLKKEIHPFLAKYYALFCFILMMGWSAANANQLTSMLASPVMGKFALPGYATGLILASLVTLILVGGVKRVANFSTRLVPFLFLLYVGASLWILAVNIELLPSLCRLVWESAWTPQAFGTGAAIGGIMSALRWGMFKGLQSNEAGIGTQTIPHSMAETESPVDQGALSMLATYSAGILCIMASFVALITQTWLDDSLALGIGMVAESFRLYFSVGGIVVVVISAFLFAFGTILGNCFNGSHCFTYLTRNRGLKVYYVASAIAVFLGSIAEVVTLWTLIDYVLMAVAVPHVLSLAYLSYKRKDLLVGVKFSTGAEKPSLEDIRPAS